MYDLGVDGWRILKRVLKKPVKMALTLRSPPLVSTSVGLL
jgi:hypothetical protein